MKSLLSIFTIFFCAGNLLFSQNEIIEKVFADKSTEFKASIELVDTIEFVNYYYDPYYYNEYTLKFGDEGFKYFVVYRNKQTNKKGLIVYGTGKTLATEAIADSISYLTVEIGDYHETYDENGLYLDYYYEAKNILFDFSVAGSSELWSVSYDGNYAIKKDGKIKRGMFRAVEFTEHVDEYSGSTVTAAFVSLEDNKLIKSWVLDQNLIRNEVYAYHYDYYYGEYDYYYDYSAPEAGYSLPTFETRLNYEPVMLTYIEKGDSIYNLIKYDYPVYNEKIYTSFTLPEDFKGVWSANNNAEGEELFILNRDEIYSAYSVLYATIDAYKGCWDFGTYGLEEALSKSKLSSDQKNQVISEWLGDKSNVRYFSFSSWTSLSTFKEYIFFNDSQMMRVQLSYLEGEISTKITRFTPEKVYHKSALSRYDQNNYVTVLLDENGKKISLPEEIYFYNYALSVSKKNIDSEGNLILTNESLGNIKFKGVNYGNEYLGKLDVQWINSDRLSGEADIVSISSVPFNIKDETGAILCSDVNYMYVANAQGFNLYQVTNSAGKVGVLGPDGTWMIKQEWDAITILGPSSSSYSESIGLPVFFVVFSGDKCGAMDSKGNFVIPMGQTVIEVCSGNLIAHKDGKVSFYDFDGKLLMGDLDEYSDSYYYSADCWSLDYSFDGNHILVKNGKFGLVDENFKVILPFEYSIIYQYPDLETYIVADSEENYGMIKSDGTVVLPMEYSNIYGFDYNPKRLIVSKEGKQGVVNEKGEVLIPIQFYSISSYSDWNSNLIEVSDENYRTNIIDTSGNSILDATCEYFYFYSYYNIVYCANQGKVDFYDLNGQLLYSKLFDYIDPYYSYGTIQVYQVGYEEPKFGAFDILSGDDLMLPEFESLYPFWIGDYVFFAGTIKGKVGIYDSMGVELVKPKGNYLDNYYYDYDEYGNYQFYVEISNKKGKSKIIKLNYNL